MRKEIWSWASARLAALPSGQSARGTARVSRWGHYGTPLLLFPSAGGDFEEVERFHLIDAIRGLVESGRIKVFSVDGLAAHAWLRGNLPHHQIAGAQQACEAFICDEVVPLIRRDCHSDTIEILAGGAAFGAFSAVALLCRHPDVFRGAIALSGTFDVSKHLSESPTAQIEAVSPLHYLPHLPEGGQLTALRRRFVQIATGEGDFEQPAQSRQLAQMLAARGVPNHLDLWGGRYTHSWATWREMLLKYAARSLSEQ
jgi:esterase/lipase superfamily enzyme